MCPQHPSCVPSQPRPCPPTFWGNRFPGSLQKSLRGKRRKIGQEGGTAKVRAFGCESGVRGLPLIGQDRGQLCFLCFWVHHGPLPAPKSRWKVTLFHPIQRINSRLLVGSWRAVSLAMSKLFFQVWLQSCLPVNLPWRPHCEFSLPSPGFRHVTSQADTSVSVPLAQVRRLCHSDAREIKVLENVFLHLSLKPNTCVLSTKQIKIWFTHLLVIYFYSTARDCFPFIVKRWTVGEQSIKNVTTF